MFADGHKGRTLQPSVNIPMFADGHKGRTLHSSDITRKIKYVSNRPTPDFITYLVG